MSAPTETLRGALDRWLADALPWSTDELGASDRGSSLRVGFDMVSVADVALSIDTFGDRYVRRMFTPHEVACCRSVSPARGELAPYSFESLAARFAAKEATVKVLRPIGPRPEWRAIEVYQAQGGWCEIRVSGQAAALADQAGIDRFAVSLTHEASMAAAVVVGVCRGAGRSARGAAPGQGEE